MFFGDTVQLTTHGTWDTQGKKHNKNQQLQDTVREAHIGGTSLAFIHLIVITTLRGIRDYGYFCSR